MLYFISLDMNASTSEDFKSFNNEKFTSKEIDILEKNKKFFSTDRKYVQAMLEIIDGKSNISIRVLDWFVANYSKKNNTAYKIKVNSSDSIFNVHIEYKNQLSGYSKQYFDPFCRKKKIIYTYHANNGGKDINFLSSIGQLNFFRWAIRFKVIQYVERHLKEIETDMKETTKLNKEKKLASQNSSSTKIEHYNDNHRNNDADPIICSSEKILNVHISPLKKTLNKTDSDTRSRRQQLSKSVYEHGIKKSNIPIKLDFD